MRYEFWKDDEMVGAAQWEGPGQVSLDLRDESDRRTFARFFEAEEFYLGSDAEEGGIQARRRDWAPWEFERACRSFARDRGFRAHRVPSGAVEERAEQRAR